MIKDRIKDWEELLNSEKEQQIKQKNITESSLVKQESRCKEIQYTLDQTNVLLKKYSLEFSKAIFNEHEIAWSIEFKDRIIHFREVNQPWPKGLSFSEVLIVDEDGQEISERDVYESADHLEDLMDKFFQKYKSLIAENK